MKLRFSWQALGKTPARRALVVVLLTAAAFASYYRFWYCRPWDQARAALADYDFALARAHLERCLTRWPNDAEVQLLLARTGRRLGDLASARSHLGQIILNKQVADDVELELLLIEVQTNVVQGEGAALERLAGAPPETPLIVEALIQGYVAAGLLEKAYAMASHWVESSPGAWYPLHVRGAAAVAAKGEGRARMAAAIRDLKAVLLLKPDHPETQLALAELYRYTGQESRGAPYYRAYLRARPANPAAAAALARCLRELDECDAARSTLDEWLAAHPAAQDPDVFRIRGQLALDANKLTQAKEWLARSYHLAGKDPDTLQLLAHVHRLAGEVKEAEKYVQEEKACRDDVARIKKLTREIALMGQACGVAQADAAKLADLYFDLGRTLLRLDRSVAGVNSLHFALRFNPDHAGARSLLDDWKRRPR